MRNKNNFFDSPAGKSMKGGSTVKQSKARPTTASPVKKDSPARKPGESSGYGPMQKRPQTGVTKSGKKMKVPKSLKDLVKKKDRLTHEEIISYLHDLLETAKRIQDPLDDIERIFNKILAWKEK